MFSGEKAQQALPERVEGCPGVRVIVRPSRHGPTAREKPAPTRPCHDLRNVEYGREPREHEDDREADSDHDGRMVEEEPDTEEQADSVR